MKTCEPPPLLLHCAAVLSLIVAIRPSVWEGTFIPIVPRELEDALHAPVPFVMGVCELAPDMRDMLAALVRMEEEEEEEEEEGERSATPTS